MKRDWTIIAMLMAVILAKNSPVLAHDGHFHRGGKSAETDENQVSGTRPSPKVTIRLFQYQPGRIQVRPGTTVTWVNEDEILHTVTAGAAAKDGGGFDGPLDGRGKSFSFTFSQPGTYTYHCDRHEHMRGEVEVR
jgi:plastocyanin